MSIREVVSQCFNGSQATFFKMNDSSKLTIKETNLCLVVFDEFVLLNPCGQEQAIMCTYWKFINPTGMFFLAISESIEYEISSQ
jgi:hypothetical protein